MSEPQTQETLKYLRSKYLRGRDTPDAAEAFQVFDPWINPDTGHIPYCESCYRAYREFKANLKDSCEMDHTSSCLWYDYFVAKIQRLNPKTQFTRKGDAAKN
jgi:hypothetical protein